MQQNLGKEKGKKQAWQENIERLRIESTGRSGKKNGKKRVTCGMCKYLELISSSDCRSGKGLEMCLKTRKKCEAHFGK